MNVWKRKSNFQRAAMHKIQLGMMCYCFLTQGRAFIAGVKFCNQVIYARDVVIYGRQWVG